MFPNFNELYRVQKDVTDCQNIDIGPDVRFALLVSYSKHVSLILFEIYIYDASMNMN